MRELESQFFYDSVVITHLTPELANDFRKHRDDFTWTDVLNQGLLNEIYQSVHLHPFATKLVAYQTQEKKAIGFLCLEETYNDLFLIRDVFVDPIYRNMGLAKRLLKYAIIVAKEKGAKKINLNVYPTRTNAIKLYEKMGFVKIGRFLLGQTLLPQSSPVRIIKHAIAQQEFLTRLAYKKTDGLFRAEINSKKERENLFFLYRRSMNKQWIDFFEINLVNFTNGSRNMWKPPFFRDIIINESGDSFALIFNSPFSYKTVIELYSPSETSIPDFLEKLLKIASRKGVSLIQIMLFNLNTEIGLKWFEKKRMNTFQFVTMGLELK
jgi:ribosomal protein S18 acetylase RimI-like enzyme